MHRFLAIAATYLHALARWWTTSYRKTHGWTKVFFLVVTLCCPLSLCITAFDTSARTAGILPTRTLVPSQTAILPPTRTPTPAPPTVTFTPAPPTATPIPVPPTGKALVQTNMYEAPTNAPESATVLAVLCADDQLEYLSQQRIDGFLWYEVRVVVTPGTCRDPRAAVGNIGWVSSSSISSPSASVETYVEKSGKLLPTSIIAPTPMPTATARPTARPTPQPAAPAAPAIPGGTRIGAICRDGSRSYATGRGACSHHGGVDHWLYAK